MDHQQPPVLELDHHHLKRDVIGIVAEVEQAGIRVGGSVGRWVQLEAQPCVLDDVSGAFT